MHANAALQPIAPDAYTYLLSLIPDEPWAVPARAVVLAGLPGVYVDDVRAPSVVAIETATPEGQSVFLFGAANHPALAAYVHALPGPAILQADALITDQIPTWRPDASVRQSASFTFPVSNADTAFAILPPGGVRRLCAADARHLTTFPAWLWAGYGSPEAMLRQGIAYARYLRAELVAIACIAGTTERYDAITAFTIERTRRNGFARECAHRLISAIRSERGRSPVLTASAENDAAIALARSLGLTTRHDQTVYDLR
ncbi:MAG: GNAT family N-acetyltransferase [Thermomicrobiales bacterium]